MPKIRMPLGFRAVGSFKTVLVVERLPKTRSGKILRQTMRKIADREDYEDYKLPATIDDPAILGEIAEVREKWGQSGICLSRKVPQYPCGRRKIGVNSVPLTGESTQGVG